MNNANGGNVIYKFIGNKENLDKTIGGVKSSLGALGKTALALGTTVASITTSLGLALVKVTQESVKAYGEFEQLQGGAKKIFDEMDFTQIEEDSRKAYKTMNLSASQYLALINDVGATFSSTMGDEKGYKTAQKGLQAISDYATGTGKSVDLLGEKFTLITRSTTSYQSIADQFSGILPQTTQDFLEQAQACGFLSDEYTRLNEVPVAEYQQAVANMLELGVQKMGLAGNTLAESTQTLTGTLASLKTSFQNFLVGEGSVDDIVENLINFGDQVGKAVVKLLPSLVKGIVKLIKNLVPKIPPLIQQLLPTFIQGVVDLATGLVKALPGIIESLASMLPDIIQQLVQAFRDVAVAVGEQMPVLMPIIVNALVDSLEVLLENADLLLEGMIALITGMNVALVKALPILIERLPELIADIVSALIECAPMLLACGPEMIYQMGKGFLEAVPNIYNNLVDSMANILEELLKIAKKFIDVGKNIVSGIWKGIKDMKNQLTEKVKNFGKGILNSLKDTLGIHSPSTEFSWVAKMSVVGFTNELTRMKDEVSQAIEGTFGLSPQLANSTALHYSPNVVVNNNIDVSTDPLGQTVKNIKTFSGGAKNDYNYGMGV